MAAGSDSARARCCCSMVGNCSYSSSICSECLAALPPFTRVSTKFWRQSDANFGGSRSFRVCVCVQAGSQCRGVIEPKSSCSVDCSVDVAMNIMPFFFGRGGHLMWLSIRKLRLRPCECAFLKGHARGDSTALPPFQLSLQLHYIPFSDASKTSTSGVERTSTPAFLSAAFSAFDGSLKLYLWHTGVRRGTRQTKGKTEGDRICERQGSVT